MKYLQIDDKSYDLVSKEIKQIIPFDLIYYQNSKINLSHHILPILELTKKCKYSSIRFLYDAIEMIESAYMSIFIGIFYYKFHEGDKDEIFRLSRYYLDRCYLDIYSSIEYIASAIKGFFNIPNNKIPNSEELNGSLSNKIGHYLSKALPEHVITKLSKKLFENKNFIKIIDFRMKYVHNQKIQLDTDKLPFCNKTSPFEEKNGEKILYIGTEPKISYEYSFEEYYLIILSSFIEYDKFLKSSTEHFITDIKNFLENGLGGVKIKT